MKKISYIIAFLLLTAGCFGGYSEASKFYTLKSITDVPAVSSKKMIIGINEIELPEYIDRPQIVSATKGSSEVKISETNRWSESLDTLIQRTITTDISAYLPQAVVKEKTINERFNASVSVQITRLDMIADDSALLEAWWYILDHSGKTVYREKFSETKKIKDNYDSFVLSISDLLSTLSKNIAKQVIKY